MLTENKNLAEEISELQNNIAETGRSLHDFEKAKRLAKRMVEDLVGHSPSRTLKTHVSSPPLPSDVSL